MSEAHIHTYIWRGSGAPQVSGVASTDTRGLGGCIDGDEDEVGFDDGLVDVGAEEEVLASALLDDLVEARLVDGQSVGVPLCNALRVHVDDGDLDVRALEGNDGASRAGKREMESQFERLRQQQQQNKSRNIPAEERKAARHKAS